MAVCCQKGVYLRHRHIFHARHFLNYFSECTSIEQNYYGIFSVYQRSEDSNLGCLSWNRERYLCAVPSPIDCVIRCRNSCARAIVPIWWRPSPLGGSTGPRWKAACFDFWRAILFKTKRDIFHRGPVLPLVNDGSPLQKNDCVDLNLRVWTLAFFILLDFSI